MSGTDSEGGGESDTTGSFDEMVRWKQVVALTRSGLMLLDGIIALSQFASLVEQIVMVRPRTTSPESSTQH